MKVVATINNPIVLRDVSDEAIALAIALDDDFWRAGFNTRSAARRWAMEQWDEWVVILNSSTTCDTLAMMASSYIMGMLLLKLQ